jgi:hypothetical protein
MPLDESLLLDDAIAPLGIQHTLVLEPAMIMGGGREVNDAWRSTTDIAPDEHLYTKGVSDAFRSWKLKS